MSTLSQIKKQQIIEALLEKKSYHQIKKELNVGNDTICKVKRELLLGIQDEFNPTDTLVRADAIKFIQKKKTFTTKQLANKLKISDEQAHLVLQQLTQNDGYNIINKGHEWKLDTILSPFPELTLDRCKGKEYKFGIVSDTHLCSKHERLDVLNLAYKEFKKQGITDVLHCGNIIDGESRFNMYELKVIGAHNQCMYVADNYPQVKGITTYFISGTCHEGWYQQQGLNIGWYIENICKSAGRNDIKHIGYVEQDVIIKRPKGNTRVRLIHPGGGSAYATSYASQKMVESFQGGDKPHILLLGHYHKFNVGYPREVLTINCGCLQNQTDFMRKHKLGAHVGFTIMTLGSRIDGTVGCADIKWYPFYDQKYHKQLEEYKIKMK